jgi:hypothetical protein
MNSRHSHRPPAAPPKFENGLLRRILDLLVVPTFRRYEEVARRQLFRVTHHRLRAADQRAKRVFRTHLRRFVDNKQVEFVFAGFEILRDRHWTHHDAGLVGADRGARIAKQPAERDPRLLQLRTLSQGNRSGDELRGDKAAVQQEDFLVEFLKPWRLAGLRDGVCYVGLVFKRIERPSGRDNACCGAQMFLGSGDGLVFRGAVGPWYSETKDAFHLQQDQAATLMEMIVRSYKDIHGTAPTELFIHGKTNFDPNEWAGFASAVPHTTKLVGVQIRDMADVKLFRYGANAVLRGTAVVTSNSSGYLWTRGYIPRLRT